MASSDHHHDLQSYLNDEDPSEDGVVQEEDEREDHPLPPPLLVGQEHYSIADLSVLSIERTSSSSSSPPPPPPTTTTTTMNVSSTDDYQSITLAHHYSHHRWSILPKVPPLTSNNEETAQDLLLCNVPRSFLSLAQQHRRDHCCDELITYENVTHSPATRAGTRLLYQLFLRLSEQWHVPVPLLVFNYELMITSMSQLMIMPDFMAQLSHLEWTLEEWKLALEFYLQIDVDCFYLKTTGLFSGTLPEARYRMERCHHVQCSYCYPAPSPHRPFVVTSILTDPQPYTCLNHYQLFLNGPVTCSSSNVLYILTCPCQHYEYIGRTQGPFLQQFNRHRRHAVRLIREFLLGEAIALRNNVHHTHHQLQQEEWTKVNAMDLYRHLVQCPVALQLFLDHYPLFWCLIPMTTEVADLDDQMTVMDQMTHSSLLQCATRPEYNHPGGTNKTRTNVDVQWYVEHVPLPPPDYRFSQRQCREQYYFFKLKLDLLWPLPRPIHLYQSTIVLTVPPATSSQLLHFLHALVVTHTECQLNTITPQFPDHFHRPIDWCAPLKRPTAPPPPRR